jgi:hypothetical protein
MGRRWVACLNVHSRSLSAACPHPPSVCWLRVAFAGFLSDAPPFRISLGRAFLSVNALTVTLFPVILPNLYFSFVFRAFSLKLM